VTPRDMVPFPTTSGGDTASTLFPAAAGKDPSRRAEDPPQHIKGDPEVLATASRSPAEARMTTEAAALPPPGKQRYHIRQDLLPQLDEPDFTSPASRALPRHRGLFKCRVASTATTGETRNPFIPEHRHRGRRPGLSEKHADSACDLPSLRALSLCSPRIARGCFTKPAGCIGPAPWRQNMSGTVRRGVCPGASSSTRWL